MRAVMADNGQNEGRSRLDRIEAALELMIQDHEQLRDEHKMLLKSQVLMQDTMEKSFSRSRERMDEIEEKLNGVIGVVEIVSREVAQASRDVAQFTRETQAMRENFDTRLRRLEDDSG